ncbi:hypothetical protein pb186bvf_021094 [Paramecium bursaria]
MISFQFRIYIMIRIDILFLLLISIYQQIQKERRLQMIFNLYWILIFSLKVMIIKEEYKFFIIEDCSDKQITWYKYFKINEFGKQDQIHIQYLS